MTKRIVLTTMFVCVSAGVAVAGGTWSDKVTHRPSTAASIKVVEPEGFKITVTTSDGDKAGTVPEVFAVPNLDAYYKVTLTAPDGTVWSKKVEVKAKYQTELTVSFKADEAKPAGPSARSYIGRLQNVSKGCGSKFESTIKAEFLRADGSVAHTAQANSNQTVEVQLASSSYEVRVYQWIGTEWRFGLTSSQPIPAKDGWGLGWGCPRGTRKLNLYAQ
jgi:hypothetical protein